LGLLVALAGSGCVTISNRGAYPPIEARAFKPAPLRVSVRPFADRDVTESQRLTEAFGRDLAAARVFDGVIQEGPWSDVVLVGAVLSTKQPGDDKTTASASPPGRASC